MRCNNSGMCSVLFNYIAQNKFSITCSGHGTCVLVFSVVGFTFCLTRYADSGLCRCVRYSFIHPLRQGSAIEVAHDQFIDLVCLATQIIASRILLQTDNLMLK